MEEEILDPRTEFRNFLILLKKDSWFCRICEYQTLEKVNFSFPKNKNEAWDYNLKKLEFKNICLDRHVRPSTIADLIKDNNYTSRLLLSIVCKSTHVRNENSARLEIIKDPIIDLGVKFVVQFDHLDTNCEIKTLQSSWHLDKHDSSKTVSSIHPLYHYEFGGSEITKTDGFHFGDFILLDTPRIMHPPLDIVLSIDFILKNFYKYQDHKKLTSSSTYKKCVQNAQHRLWRPYLISLSSHFHDFTSIFEIDRQYASQIMEC